MRFAIQDVAFRLVHMPAEENVALRKGDRVVRLFPGRGREHGGALSEAAASNDVAVSSARSGADAVSVPSSQSRAQQDDVAARLDDDLESRLREPLSRIATMAGVLKHEIHDQHTEQVAAILAAADRADGMFKDLLNFVRSGMGGMRIARRRVDLKLLCERVIDAIHNAHPDHPLLFSCDSRLEGQFDPDAIASLLSKLVLNAMQHGAQRPAIRVELRGVGNDVLIDVWNGGPALDPELTGRLFEPFVCGRPLRPASAEGLGLGLYLAREIVRAHAGRIDVTSSERDGTTFRVTLPRW